MNIINTPNAPAAIGPYVQEINTGDMLIVSGQLPIDPVSGTISNSIEIQMNQSLENVKSIVESAGLKVDNIIKTTVFVTDLNDFMAVNHVYEIFFKQNGTSFPARSCVEVVRLPKDTKIEIEAIAVA